MGAGQKSGMYWAADAATGEILWGTQVGPGGAEGGMQWGAATDGTRIYVAEADSDGVVLHAGRARDQSVTYGSWAALDPQSGRIQWQTPDPARGSTSGRCRTADGRGLRRVADRVHVRHQRPTGKVLWRLPWVGKLNRRSGHRRRCRLLGKRVRRLGGTGSTTFYAFHLPPAGGARR